MMTNETAISILNEQISSARFINEKTYKSWQSQTQSVIKDLFGIASSEYSFIITFSFTNPYSKSSINTQIGEGKPTVIDFLERCIVTINRKDLFQPPKPIIQYVDRIVPKVIVKESVKKEFIQPQKRSYFKSLLQWLKSRDALALITFVILVLGPPFWLGWYLGENKAEIKNIELRKENKQLIIDTTNMGSKYRLLINSSKVSLPLKVANNKTDSDAKGDKKDASPNTINHN